MQSVRALVLLRCWSSVDGIAVVLVPVGRMALTNDPALALWILQGWWRRRQLDRSELVVFVVAVWVVVWIVVWVVVWVVQILCSSLWLRYFTRGHSSGRGVWAPICDGLRWCAGTPEQFIGVDRESGW